MPRRIHAREVVKRGFMSNFLFQNIASVFRAPAEVVEIIQRFDPYEQGKAQNAEKNKVEIDEGTADELSINDEGDVEIPDEQVVGKAADIFGPKVYGDVVVEFSGQVEDIAKAHAADDDDRAMLENLKEAFKQSVTAPLVQAAKESYGSELKPRSNSRSSARSRQTPTSSSTVRSATTRFRRAASSSRARTSSRRRQARPSARGEPTA